VSELATESDDKQYPYKSKGKKEAHDSIKLDKGNAYKGQLHYIAEFVPALALKGIEFEQDPNELQRAAGGEGGDGEEVFDRSGVTRTHEDDEEQVVPEGITARTPVGATRVKKSDSQGGESVSTTTAANVHKTTESIGKKDETQKEKEGVEMSKTELLEQRKYSGSPSELQTNIWVKESGIIIFNVKSGRLSKKARFEVLLDDGYWPAFSTAKARSVNAQWEHVGEGFVKELDFGRVWLRLNEADEGYKDDVISEWKGDTKTFLQGTLVKLRSLAWSEMLSDKCCRME
jgi:hypothetical protein